MNVAREQVLAFRVAAQQLDRSARQAADLAVLDIGLQDTATHPAQLAFAARLPADAPMPRIGPGQPLALVWSLRGAPHVHRRRDLDAVAAAMWPLSEQDAAGRLNETGPSVTRAGIPALEQFELARTAMREVVAAPADKGTVSTAVTTRIPEVMRRNCRVCGTMHISDSAMRSTSLAAGVELEPGTAPPVLLPRKGAHRPQATDDDALRRLIRAYLAVLGPATVQDVAGYYDIRSADLKQVWPDDLVEVRVAATRAWLPEAGVRLLENAPTPRVVRLLGPFDPWVQARDRALIVPDKAMHKALWPVLGRPGVVLVDGEVLGVWRPRATGSRLSLAVEAFAPLKPATWTDIDAEAERVAAVRGASAVAVERV